MQVYHNAELPQFNNVIITIGTFDGVHLGHKAILDHIHQVATNEAAQSLIISFSPHPRTVLQPNAPLQLLSTEEEKIELFKQHAIDYLVLYPFTTQFAAYTAQQYIEDFIIKVFAPKLVVIGYDHHFGKGRTGNYNLLQTYAIKGYFKLQEIPATSINNSNVSSTKIRNALLNGNLALANQLLGYAYNISGTVIQGKQLGRTIGFKTANIALNNTLKLVPAVGVYVVQVTVLSHTYTGMMNIGYRPTVQGNGLTIEVHILQFDMDIYGAAITVTMLHRLRDEVKFESTTALKQQLELDKLATIQYKENQEA